VIYSFKVKSQGEAILTEFVEAFDRVDHDSILDIIHKKAFNVVLILIHNAYFSELKLSSPIKAL